MTSSKPSPICIQGANAHNLKNIDVEFEREKITVVTGVSGSGKSSLVFDTLLSQAKHHFFSTLPHFHRGFFHMGGKAEAQKISGLSLAISLEQAETAPSSRSTVATLTNIGELIGVLWSRFAEQRCPSHGEICHTSSTPAQLAESIVGEFNQRQIAVIAPLAERKMGLFRKEIHQARQNLYPYIFINDQIYSLNEQLPGFHPRKKYTVKVIVQVMSATTDHQVDLSAAIAAATSWTDGYFEICEILADPAALVGKPAKYSTLGGCPECGFSWPPMDSRFFSQNSLGRCPDCDGMGSLKESELGVDSHLYQHDLLICQTCNGTGLNPELDAITIAGHSVRSLYQMEMRQLAELVDELPKILPIKKKNDAFAMVLRELKNEVSRVCMLGLGHLSLERRILSLSHGERQRLRLSGILTEPLSGVLYILDEPSQGLHPADLETIWDNILTLRALGNTIIIVDHDEFCWKKADHIIELGPGGGIKGGQVTACFKPSEAMAWQDSSRTAQSLVTSRQVGGFDSSSTPGEFITISQIRYRHLDIGELKIQKHAINVVTGVSGVGKTTLVMGVVAQNVKRWEHYQKSLRKDPDGSFQPFHVGEIHNLSSDTRAVIVDRKPMAKSSVSIPATYLDCMGDLRDIFASLPAAQIAGLTKKHFSLMSDLGRCPVCGGKGYIKHSMKFLADAKEVCGACKGKRFQDFILSVTYKGYSIADLLDLTIEEVAEIFQNHRKLHAKLAPAVSLGLGYLSFGQPSRSLSGGEAQRLKLATYLREKRKHSEILLIDEPTRGLHVDDVEFLISSLKKMADFGSTIILVEHNDEVLRKADWIVDLGHGGGCQGGKKIFAGDVASFYHFSQSHPGLSKTGEYLFRPSDS